MPPTSFCSVRCRRFFSRSPPILRCRRCPRSPRAGPRNDRDSAMIEIDRVSKSFDGRRVVDELSLSVPEGAFCVLLGPSGCGKSTTLRMINRLVAFDSGVIRVGGEDVRRVPSEALRRRVGDALPAIGPFPHSGGGGETVPPPPPLECGPRAAG